ncbi:MAG TPA: nitroreductase family deazaflavin-dependent oxidoreductase, partial [Chloroflexota bacterium]|nr:nitroreductase family deazaflavin-dependent oxidoreductase [Chloroflexota bacterium]
MVSDWNKHIIDEFRANGGKVGGQFEGAPLLLLTSTGAKTGQSRTNPMMYLSEDGRYYVFASKGGAPTNPDWYLNLIANPRASIEVGTECVFHGFWATGFTANGPPISRIKSHSFHGNGPPVSRFWATHFTAMGHL